MYMIYFDVCRPLPLLHSQATYMVSFIDYYTCYTNVYFMHNKFETFEKFQEFLAFNEQCRHIYILYSNHGGEYKST